MPRRPKNELAALARASRTHLKRAELIGKSLDRRLKEKIDASDEFTLTEDDRRDFSAITDTLKHAGSAMMKALENNKRDLGEQTEAQLEAQFREEIIRTAQSMSDEDWQRMCEAREKARIKK